MRFLRRRRHRYPRADSQREQQPAELKSQFHVTLHLLIGLGRLVRLYWLRQFCQHIEIREHIVILKHWNIFLRHLRLSGA